MSSLLKVTTTNTHTNTHIMWRPDEHLTRALRGFNFPRAHIFTRREKVHFRSFSFHLLSERRHKQEYKDQLEYIAMSEIDDYVKTSNGNFVSRKAEIYGSQNLFIKGKSIIMPRVLVRGELQSIRIGRFCVIGESTVLRPAYRIEPDGSQLKCRFTPLSVGNYTSIGKDCIIEAAGIGCNVRIDDGCILGRNSFVRDNSHLLEGTILPEDAVVPPFTVMGGCPAKAVSVLHESTVTMCPEDAVAFYDAFETRS